MFIKVTYIFSITQYCNYKKKSQKSRVIEKVRCKTSHFLLLAKSDFLAMAEAEGLEPPGGLHPNSFQVLTLNLSLPIVAYRYWYLFAKIRADNPLNTGFSAFFNAF